MDKVMFSKERLLKYIKLGVYRPAQIIFKKLFEIKSRYDHPLGSSDLIGPTRQQLNKPSSEVNFLNLICNWI